MELCHLRDIGLPVQSTCQQALTLRKGAACLALPSGRVSDSASKGGEAQARDMRPENALAQPAAQTTRALYMEGTYVFQCSACVLDMHFFEETGKLGVELDQTVFHPQGGGQPSDRGQLCADGLPNLAVTFVTKDKAKEGVIRHDCEGDVQAWLRKGAGMTVTCQVDESTRRSNARLHSAGHLLDVAIFGLGFRWQPGKGYHFADGHAAQPV
ncbi:unnamed protein product [Effrenium voratum]|nr:unnamed protein product [Effrenium voratum]